MKRKTPKELVLETGEHICQRFAWSETLYRVWRCGKNPVAVGSGNGPRQAWANASKNLKGATK